MKKLIMLALTGAAMSLSSCIQSDQVTTVNPDGSGKFTMKVSLNMGGMGGLMQLGKEGGEGGGKMPDMGKEMLLTTIGKSEGVDVWSAATSETDAEGKTNIVLEGYFKDISKLKISATMSGQGGAEASSDMPEISGLISRKDDKGNWILEIPLDAMKKAAAKKAEEKKGEEKTEETAPAKMTEEEIKAKIEEAKMQFGMMKGMMGAMMKDMKTKNTVIVGGTITDAGLFKKEGENKASVEVGFSKIMDAMEKMINDPELAKKAAAKGGDLMKNIGEGENAAMMMEAMLGKGEPRLVITPGEPIFDYAAESAKAKGAQSDGLKALIEEAKAKAKDGGAPAPVDEIN